jgi:hypothetical protein
MILMVDTTVNPLAKGSIPSRQGLTGAEGGTQAQISLPKTYQEKSSAKREDS